MSKQPIILVNPGEDPQTEALEKNSDHGVYMFPYSLLFLQNYLLTENIESQIIDLYRQESDKLFDIIKEAARPVIGVTAQPHSALKALDLISKIKAINNDSLIVVGGNFFTNTRRDVLTRFKEVDVVVRGEGEITFCEFVKAIRENKSPDTIDGITYRKNGIIIENRNRSPERDLEKVSLKYERLPLTDRFREGILIHNFEKENYRSYPVFLGRGCPGKCVFCEYNQFSYRVRRIPFILQELDFLINNYGAKFFTFADPSFCIRDNFVRELCGALIEKYPRIRWSCEARIDTPPETLELMAKAGCISIDFGLESGSEKVLKAINKNISLARTAEFVKTCYSLGIRTHMFLMVSLPDETEEDAMHTLRVSGEISKYVTSMSLAVTQILPGTELERLALDKGLLPSDFSYYDERFFHKHTRFCDKHIPIYFEHLNITFIEKFFDEVMDLRARKYDSLNVLIRKACKGIFTLHKRPAGKNLVYIRRFILAAFRKITRQ